LSRKVHPTSEIVQHGRALCEQSPQVSVADNGTGWPKWQVFLGFNMQFK
jgi:hypothetical protein